MQDMDTLKCFLATVAVGKETQRLHKENMVERAKQFFIPRSLPKLIDTSVALGRMCTLSPSTSRNTAAGRRGSDSASSLSMGSQGASLSRGRQSNTYTDSGGSNSSVYSSSMGSSSRMSLSGGE